ncbi:MAG: hypothetical protein HUU22_00730 [Phycisphaerae bacterium]|nr:hypothetical protein [Phycisphaerae bacterium]NUQ44539.1 hypothetical protein [Phycisphaerae bacterium]
MNARITMCIGTAALLVAAGCGIGMGSGTLPAAAAFGDPLTAQPCDRSYHNEGLGFGFQPPGDATGPDMSRTPPDNTTLFSGAWTTPRSRVFNVSVVKIGTSTFENAIQSARNAALFSWRGILEDRPISFDSGRTGWLLRTGTNTGAIETFVFDVRRGLLFTLGVDVTGATSDELDRINKVLLSFCVEP